MNEYEDPGLHEEPVVARYLRSLQDPAPPAALWQRIEAQRRRRRMTRIAGYAAAASLAGAVALGALLARPDAIPTAPPMLAVQPVVEKPGIADVRALDRQLQAAYERGADEASMQPLWEARNRAVAELATAPGAGPSISVL